MGVSPFQVVRDFEAELCRYTGAPFAVAVNSCTMALLLAVRWAIRDQYWMTPPFEIEIPNRTYVSVPMSIINAGGRPEFRVEEWSGAYQLKPFQIWDSARYFTQDLWKIYGGFVCCSFHASKTLGIEQGGAILHDSPEADPWLRRMRFDGRTEDIAPMDDNFREIGFHCYMSPSVAAQGLLKLHSLPRHNAPLPNDAYPSLSEMEIFR